MTAAVKKKGRRLSKKQRKAARRILLAGILYAALIILEHTLLRGLFSRWYLALLFYLVPYLIVGFDVLRKAFLGIRNRQLFDESFLMTLATIGAFATRENREAVAVMLFYQVGEFFQDYAVDRSRESIRDLMDIAPDEANRLLDDGSVETIDPDEIEVGDSLLIRPGDRIPVDGVVTEGESMINTAALTGEPIPRSTRAGDALISGCINGDGLLHMRAEKIYDDSTVARILELVETASEKKSRTEQFITRFARWYTPIVVLAALVLALIPPIFLGHWGEWILRACTFLVISCPCALVISVPLAFFGGIGAASKIGVLVKGSNYLETLAALDTVISDKTGTLTKGNFRVSDLICQDGVTQKELLFAAASAESSSSHPIALSILEAFEAEQPGVALDTESLHAENFPGRGVRASREVDDKTETLLVGTLNFLKEQSVDVADPRDFTSQDGAPEPAKDATIVHVAKDARYLGAICIRDEIKEEAALAILDCKQVGVREFVMLTGDRASVGEAVAASLGIDRVKAELLPTDKMDALEELLSPLAASNQKRLAYIGDGINDAPVLARADVGIAMGSLGSDAAIEAADVVIMDDKLSRIPQVIRIARQTVGIARQNIVFALAVKILVLILGAAGLANMWAAVFADVGVAVLCILNSMRLLSRPTAAQRPLT